MLRNLLYQYSNIRTHLCRKMCTQPKLVLGIETSCDDTGVAIVDSEGRIHFEALSSQFDTHLPFGGVVPKLAKRDHEINLPRLLKEAELSVGSFDRLSAVAATAGPGLALCLRVGYRAGRELAFHRQLPFVAVNHLEAHVLVPRLEQDKNELKFPYLALLVSGGHCMILLTRGVDDHVRLGTTHDDSLGEAYDKVARMLELESKGGGGGPALELIAKEGDEDSIPFPVPLRHRKDCMFSFSGLKTAVYLACNKLGDGSGGGGLTRSEKANVAASFQKAARVHLQQRLKYALDWCDQGVANGTLLNAPTCVVVTGGVASNQYLRDHLTNVVKERNDSCDKEDIVENEKDRTGSVEMMHMDVRFPPLRLCTDNGVMVAWAGQERLALGMSDDSTPPIDGLESFKTRWPLGGEEIKSKKGRVMIDVPIL